MGFFRDLFSGKKRKATKNAGTAQPVEKPIGDITLFEYDYIGSIGADSHTYTLKKDEDKWTFTFSGMQYSEYGEVQKEAGPEVIAALKEACERNGVGAWDGFNESNPEVLDGDGFSFTMRFADGTRLRAGGSNAYPKGYFAFLNEMNGILAPLREEVLAEKRKEIIANFKGGEFEGGLFNFIQKGSAGSDSYFAMIFKQGTRTSNCEIRVKTAEYSNLPGGELKIMKTVPDEVLHLSEIDEIIKKYNLIEWYDYDKAAKDYNNSEWFQISLGYGETSINACGTEHPKHYDAFRKAFLAVLKKIIDEAKDL